MGEVSGNPIQVPVLAVLSSEMPREIRHPFITVSYERSSKRWTGMICYSLKSSAQPLLGNGIKPFMKDIALLGITKSDLICRNSHWYLPSQSGSLALCIRKFCRIGSRKLSGIFWKKKKKEVRHIPLKELKRYSLSERKWLVIHLSKSFKPHIKFTLFQLSPRCCILYR